MPRKFNCEVSALNVIERCACCDKYFMKSNRMKQNHLTHLNYCYKCFQEFVKVYSKLKREL